MPTRLVRAVATMCIAVSTANCALICLSQQHRGPVKTLTGVVQPGEIVTIELPYDARGDQNDLKLSWDGQRDVGGPRPGFYLSEITCEHFVPPARPAVVSRGSCRNLGSRGSFKNPAGELVLSLLGVVGGPNQGPTNALRKNYRLHIVGDPVRAVRYVVEVTWFRGANC